MLNSLNNNSLLTSFQGTPGNLSSRVEHEITILFEALDFDRETDIDLERQISGDALL